MTDFVPPSPDAAATPLCWLAAAAVKESVLAAAKTRKGTMRGYMYAIV